MRADIHIACMLRARMQALVDLHFFMQSNPDQDIDSMLSSASTTFKSFINRGLYKVGAPQGFGSKRIMQGQ